MIKTSPNFPRYNNNPSTISGRNHEPLGSTNIRWNSNLEKFWSHPDYKKIKDVINFYAPNKSVFWKNNLPYEWRRDRIRQEFDQMETVYFNPETGALNEQSLMFGAALFAPVKPLIGLRYLDAVEAKSKLIFNFSDDLLNFGTSIMQFVGFISTVVGFAVLGHDNPNLSFFLGLISGGGLLIGLELMKAELNRFLFNPEIIAEGAVTKANLNQILNPNEFYQDRPQLYGHNVKLLLERLNELASDAYVFERHNDNPMSASEKEDRLERISRFKRVTKEAHERHHSPVVRLLHEDEGAVSIVGSEDLRGRVSLVEGDL